MADVNLELEAAMRQVNAELQYFGRVTQATADQMRDAQVGVKGFSNAVRETPKALGKAAGDMTSAMYRGAQGSKAFNSSVDAMAQAANNAATVLTAMLPGGVIVKALLWGLSKLTTGVSAAAKVALEQSDATYKSFTELSRAGAIGAQGTTGLANAAQRAGYNLLEMGDVIEKINGAAPQLALLGGTVSQGADVIHRMNAEAYKMGETFQRMGIMPEEQRAYVIQFTKQQIAMGRQMVGQFDASGNAIKNFVMESEALTRITGQQRQQQQEALERAMSNEVFGATIDRLRNSNQRDVADQLGYVQKLLGGFSAQVQSAAADMASNRGLPSEDAAKFNQATMGEFQRFMQRIHAGEFKNQEQVTAGFEQVLAGMSEFYNSVGITAAELKTLNQYSISQQDFARAQAMQQQGIAKSYRMANGELMGLVSGADDLTSAQAKQVQLQRQLTTTLQALTQIAVPAAVDGFNSVTSAALAAAEALLKIAGRTSEQRARQNTTPTPGGAAPGGETGPFNRVTIGMPGTTLTPEQALQVARLRDTIAKAESEGGDAPRGSGYTKLVGGKNKEDLTSMTLEQVQALQAEMVRQGSSGAAGRYQVIPDTLEGIIKQLKKQDENFNVKTQKFDQDFQDKIANILIARRGYKQYAENPTDEAKSALLKRLALEWRGLPTQPGMKPGEPTDPEAQNPNLTPEQRAKYKNKAVIGWDEAIQSFAKGGIANMPQTGGLANLHGTEAVVPLPDGKTIPVVMKNDFSDLRRAATVDVSRITREIERVQADSTTKDTFDMEKLTAEITAAVQNAANSIANNVQLGPILEALQEITRYQRENVNVSERMLRNTLG